MTLRTLYLCSNNLRLVPSLLRDDLSMLVARSFNLFDQHRYLHHLMFDLSVALQVLILPTEWCHLWPRLHPPRWHRRKWQGLRLPWARTRSTFWSSLLLIPQVIEGHGFQVATTGKWSQAKVHRRTWKKPAMKTKRMETIQPSLPLLLSRTWIWLRIKWKVNLAQVRLLLLSESRLRC